MYKLINNTHYNTDYLTNIINECIKITGIHKLKKIKFKYHKNIFNKTIDWCGGYAYVGGSKIIIKLPENNNWLMNSNIGKLENKSQIIATVIIHEFGHLIKVKHFCGLTIEHFFIEQIKKNFKG